MEKEDEKTAHIRTRRKNFALLLLLTYSTTFFICLHSVR